jgi:hypothetical protein
MSRALVGAGLLGKHALERTGLQSTGSADAASARSGDAERSRSHPARPSGHGPLGFRVDRALPRDALHVAARRAHVDKASVSTVSTPAA